jgi:hypothetical protein
MNPEVAAIFAGLLVVAYNVRLAVLSRHGRRRGPFM